MTTQPCVSIGTGTLSPDLRVFYQYGMVLGLDDFLQEQTHNLNLDYHHERALHGYGTVYGLQVTTSTPSDAPADVTVTVDPGMAIDQFGREVTVPTAQCARLGAWLAAQEEASAGTVEANLGISGELVIYVVAAYAECRDNLVPVPGQPCSTSSQLQVPSRLRDAWDIELRWAPPSMPAWDVVRQLARLLNSVQVVPGLDPALSSEQALTDAVLALPLPQTPSDAPSGSPPGPASYQLPADGADDAFGRILTVWVTQVRPQLPPDLTAPDPSLDPSVLLAAITVYPQLPFSAASPVITSYSAPDDTGRPYLLHTGLIQELRLGGGAQAPAPPAVQEAVTLSATAGSSGAPTLLAWFHLAQPVSLPATINVISENGQAGAFTTTATSGTAFSPTWTLSAPDGYTVADGDELAATFPGAAVMVGDNATTLAAALATALPGQSFVGAASTGDVTAYAPVRVPAAPPAPPASVPFVTVTYVPFGTPVSYDRPEGQGAYLELWFHLQPTGLTENVVVLKLPEVQVVNDLTGTWPGGGTASPTPAPTNQPSIWTIAATDIKEPLFLRLLVSTEETEVRTPQGAMSLAAWIARSGLRYVGWDGKTIVSFVRIGAATVLQGGE